MLTASQLQALEISHHLSVTANAGSGKTMVLVERYVDILISGRAHVNEVVAITFTEKAASELKRKISERVAKKIAEATDVSVRSRLEEIREQLPAAVVDTIHSFCSRILREYPVEAGVDAAFTVLEGVDQIILLEAAKKEAFRSILQEEPATAKREQLFDLLRALGKFRVLDIVQTLALKREQVEPWILPGGLYNRTDAEVLAHWRNHLSGFVEREFDDALLMRDMQEIIDAAGGKMRLGVKADFNVFKRVASPVERLKLFDDLSCKMLTKGGDLRKNFFGDGEDRVAAQAARLKAKYKSLTPLLEFVQSGNDEAHRQMLARSRVLLELYQDVAERYEQKKMDLAQLDFDDLQIRTKNLLRDEKVRKKLAQRFKYIMVDEYQDTNRLQYEILLPLVDGLKRGNLFIVGDPKQSIYGFRDADVGVFNRTKEEIVQSTGTGGTVVLSDSFRPLRDIVAFVNLVFDSLMKAEESDSDVAYERLVRGRQNAAPGAVELILRPSPVEGVEEEVLTEGELIARRILQLHSNRVQVYAGDETPHDVKFSDIAILLRSRNGLAGIEEAFLHHNIPYLVSGGIGYFQTQGIYDFYNYFRFLLNTEDDVALVGILRSPLFNISDAVLFEVAYERRAPSLWKHLSSKKINKAPGLERAINILKSDIAVASRLPVPDLVNRILDETSYAGFVAGTPRAGQVFANLEKLKRLARKYEDQGFTNLYDFTGRLKRLIEEEEEEGQAAVDVFADAVKIMTIHAAKGLEFPVVIVPGLERTFQSDKEPFLDAGLGLAFLPSQEGEKESVPIAEFLKRKARLKNIAEEKRVFYVACTRARDRLILSGLIPGNRATNSYMNWLLKSLQVEEEITASQMVYEVVTESLQEKEDQFINVAESHRLGIAVIRPEDLVDSPRFVAQLQDAGEKKTLLLAPLPMQPQGEMFSASKIRTYVECPSKYYLRYVAGLPAAGIRGAGDSTDEEESDVSIPADLRGRAFHYIMQHIATVPHDVQSVTSELRKFILRDSLSILSEPSIELGRIAESVMDVVRSGFWAGVLSGTDTKTEFTIMTAMGGNFLVGTLDRVYRDSDGIWNVLDYKTDSGAGGGLEQKASRYEAQIKFYALLVRKFFNVQEVRATLLFTSALATPVRYSFTLRQLEVHERQLSEIIAKITRQEFGRTSFPCADCPLAPEGCPARF